MEKRGSIMGGLILITVGAFFLALQFFPGVARVLHVEDQWPLFIVAAGALFLLGAVLGSPGLAVPGSFIGGLGLLMYVQNLTGNWESWAYAWTLFPGFVGAGVLLMHTLEGEPGKGMRKGGRLMLISAGLFIVFAGFFLGIANTGILWPLVLIGAGVILLLQNLRRRKG